MLAYVHPENIGCIGVTLIWPQLKLSSFDAEAGPASVALVVEAKGALRNNLAPTVLTAAALCFMHTIHIFQGKSDKAGRYLKQAFEMGHNCRLFLIDGRTHPSNAHLPPDDARMRSYTAWGIFGNGL